MEYPHLIETTKNYYSQPTFALGVGMSKDDLTDEEKQVLEESNQYITITEQTRNSELLQGTINGFNGLKGIADTSAEALRALITC